MNEPKKEEESEESKPVDTENENKEDEKEKEKDKEEMGSDIQGCYAQVELTDGWYGVTGVLDKVLTQALRKGKILPGQKLRIYGSKVINNFIYNTF